jgi:S-DNA-T family DNA segregation ATPase FtsK/SpoIIIE
MLYTNGNDVVRIQCAFIDTPEVEKSRILLVHKSIRHRIFTSGIHGEDSGINLDVDISERDTLFREAAEVIVNAQRLGIIVTKKTKTRQQSRLIDQLEAAGIVGPFEGSKARGVHIQT